MFGDLLVVGGVVNCGEVGVGVGTVFIRKLRLLELRGDFLHYVVCLRHIILSVMRMARALRFNF